LWGNSFKFGLLRGIDLRRVTKFLEPIKEVIKETAKEETAKEEQTAEQRSGAFFNKLKYPGSQH